MSAPCGCGCTTAFCRLPGGGTVPLLWWVELDLIPLITSAGSSGVFLAVCQPSMALGSLSANGWVCVTVLLVVGHESSSTGACWPFGGARSKCSDGNLWENTHKYSKRSGVLWWFKALDSGLPPQWLRPNSWLEHQDRTSHMAQERKKRKKQKPTNQQETQN